MGYVSSQESNLPTKARGRLFHHACGYLHRSCTPKVDQAGKPERLGVDIIDVTSDSSAL